MQKENFKLYLELEPNLSGRRMHYYADGSKLDNAFTDFINRYSGLFFIEISGNCLQLDLFPDFSMIFDEIPTLLLRAINGGDKDETSNIWFVEQDIDLRLYMKIMEDKLELSVEVAPRSKNDLYIHNGSKWIVDRRTFFFEWIALLRHVLDQMIMMDPSLPKERSYSIYKNRVDEVENLF